MMHMECDAALIEKSLQGDHVAFEALVSRYRPLLYAYLRKLVGNHEQAEDLVQAVWLQLYLSLPQLVQSNGSEQRTLSLRPWLLRVARNRCIDASRRRPLRCFSDLEVGEVQDEPLEEQFIDPGPLPEEEAEQRDQQTSIRAAISTLPVKFRAVVFLRSKEFSFQEIAQQLQMPESTARVYFHRACPLLRAALTPLVISKESEK